MESKTVHAPNRKRHVKAHGVHYTPPDLAAFLAQAIVANLPLQDAPLAILDPACGDGGLLLAIAECLSPKARGQLSLTGFETDPVAINQAGALLAAQGFGNVTLRTEDFLFADGVDQLQSAGQRSLFDLDLELPATKYDVVIANPPYVRTQVLGAERAQQLARRFGLSGRVDLYHAFIMAMAASLKPGGVLGLLTSNRFLTIRSGAAVRRLLRNEFDLLAIHDLGDTKLFSAAVLPAIIIARKQRPASDTICTFDRVYESRATHEGRDLGAVFPSILEALKDRRLTGLIRTTTGDFQIERGILPTAIGSEIWSLSTPDSTKWLVTVHSRRVHSFDDVCHIRVGIKTTCDEVFIRDDWSSLPLEMQPERNLLRPLIRHHRAARWLPTDLADSTQVFYPHQMLDGKRTAVNLDDCPRARAYLDTHRTRLTNRRYVVDAGRKWYEIWVPHNPDDWARPKIVSPDIAENPRFFFVADDAVINGDCYWLTLRRGMDPQWLFLMLAVGNSSFITKYYDTVFHNKLYSGRRRFMTQYVKSFPLPELSTPTAQEVVRLVTAALEAQKITQHFEEEVDRLVWESFGLSEEIGR